MKALFILAPGNFRDEEFFSPKEKLQKAGIHVTVAGLSMNESTGMLGRKAKPDILLKDASIGEYDVLVLPGGRGSREYLTENPDVVSAVRKAYEKGIIVAAICSSCIIPAKAGIVKGKNATCFSRPEDVALLKNAGAKYMGVGVVVDGNLITATGPSDSDGFADRILEALKKQKT